MIKISKLLLYVINNLIITVRNEVAKVMFFTRVCDPVHGGGGVCYPSMHCRWYPNMALQQGGSAPGGVCSRGEGLLRGGGGMLGGWRSPKSRRLLLWTVHILLECILVSYYFAKCIAKCKICILFLVSCIKLWLQNVY